MGEILRKTENAFHLVVLLKKASCMRVKAKQGKAFGYEIESLTGLGYSKEVCDYKICISIKFDSVKFNLFVR